MFAVAINMGTYPCLNIVYAWHAFEIVCRSIRDGDPVSVKPIVEDGSWFRADKEGEIYLDKPYLMR
jgi:hypothetical protein